MLYRKRHLNNHQEKYLCLKITYFAKEIDFTKKSDLEGSSIFFSFPGTVVSFVQVLF